MHLLKFGDIWGVMAFGRPWASVPYAIAMVGGVQSFSALSRKSRVWGSDAAVPNLALKSLVESVAELYLLNNLG